MFSVNLPGYCPIVGEAGRRFPNLDRLTKGKDQDCSLQGHTRVCVCVCARLAEISRFLTAAKKVWSSFSPTELHWLWRSNLFELPPTWTKLARALHTPRVSHDSISASFTQLVRTFSFARILEPSTSATDRRPALRR